MIDAQARHQPLPWPLAPRGMHGWLAPDEISGSAGLLRNAGANHTTGRWICFLDDDDWIQPQYVEHLAQHEVDHPRTDVVVFRMHDPKLGILPRPDEPRIAWSNVGISFAVKSEIMGHFQFERERPQALHNEDWLFLQDLQRSGKKFFISPHVDYMVRDAQ